jgi:hypothetical protein
LRCAKRLIAGVVGENGEGKKGESGERKQGVPMLAHGVPPKRTGEAVSAPLAVIRFAQRSVSSVNLASKL